MADSFFYPFAGESAFFLGLFNALPWSMKRYIALFFFLCIAAGVVKVIVE